ncbi:MAG: tRNA (cytidine(34)-2'-O)-methyltransferase [bacterium]|nr:tRNA (cytidine(34)-2'-O)-methyltransferase [bacterium]
MAVTTSLHVALVRPEIPWNTGNVGRTCLALGARLHLIAPLGFSLEARQVRRAGLDYWQYVEPRVWACWEEFAEALPRLGEPFFFTAEATRGLWSVRYPERSVLIFGSETAGLPPALRERYRQQLVSIPMRDSPVRSLNLSTSVAVAAVEVLRQWRCFPSLRGGKDKAWGSSPGQ